jgi:vacuolar-type H+-ATPase subunit I/STV1
MTFDEIKELFLSDKELSFHDKARIVEAIEKARPLLEEIERLQLNELITPELEHPPEDTDNIRYVASSIQGLCQRREGRKGILQQHISNEPATWLRLVVEQNELKDTVHRLNSVSQCIEPQSGASL